MLTRIFLSVMLVLSFAAAAHADAVILKGGKRVEGKILRETSYSLQINVNGFPYTYYRYEIDRVEREGDKIAVPVTPATEELTQRKKELVLRLLEANGSKEATQRIFLQATAQLPPEQQESFRKFFKPDEIIGRLVPVYAKYFTAAELEELILFYKSPVGQKQLESAPSILDEMMKITVEYFKEKAAKADAAQAASAPQAGQPVAAPKDNK